MFGNHPRHMAGVVIVKAEYGQELHNAAYGDLPELSFLPSSWQGKGAPLGSHLPAVPGGSPSTSSTGGCPGARARDIRSNPTPNADQPYPTSTGPRSSSFLAKTG